MSQGQELPHTVYDLETEAIIAAPDKVVAQLSSVPDIHAIAVYRLASTCNACYT